MSLSLAHRECSGFALRIQGRLKIASCSHSKSEDVVFLLPKLNTAKNNCLMMSCKVEWFDTVEKGVGLCATVPVSPGEELYVAEPFVYTVKETARGIVCEFCLVEQKRLLRCSQCKYAKYCSKECQAKAWPDHKRECKCLDSVFTSDHVDTFRIAIRSVFKMIRDIPCPSEHLCSMLELCDSMDIEGAFESHDHMFLTHMKEEIAHLLELPKELVLSKLLLLVELRHSTIFNATLLKAGVGLYPTIVLLKHSCEPNCFVAFIGSAAHLRAIRKIQAGEQLTIAWFNPTIPTELRQKVVQSRFHFKCHCRRCETRYLDENMLAGDKQASDQTKELIMVLKGLRSKKQWREVQLVCETQLARNAGRVPDENIYQLEILHSAMEACMILGRPKEGLSYGYRALKTSKMYSSGITHESANLLIEIASLHIVDGNVFKAFKTMREASNIFKLFLGRSHPYVMHLMETRDENKMEGAV